KEARQQLLALVAANPAHTQALGTLTEIALQRREWEEAQHWEGELRRVEGVEGTNCLVYCAQRLIGQASGANDPGLLEAEKLLRVVENRRPAWSAAFALEGLLNERMGRPERAIEVYDTAIRLG